ncbi:hypothetical protein C2G38_2145189 [Gigaspora rosea]|uniref:Uncharacterized protein n=1 Tax=Gigaspora rosea TaxID=44941 RepID=A0A397US64_9GLOM|nr:hypothetical protein C2G38_2145189 [Gigaspora rosea]
MPDVLNDKIPQVYGGNKEKGLAVNYGDKITLMNNRTGQNHNYMLNYEYQEVTCVEDRKASQQKWSLPHYVATIRENCKYATKDNTYSASLRAWNGSQVVTKEADKLWVEPKSWVKHSGMLKTIRKMDKITFQICEDLLEPFESVPKNVKDLKVLINALLTCYFCPDFVYKIKKTLIFKGKEKACHISIKVAEKELIEKFN